MDWPNATPLLRALRRACVPAALVASIGCQSSRSCCDGGYTVCEPAPLPCYESHPLPADAEAGPNADAPPPPGPMPEPGDAEPMDPAPMNDEPGDAEPMDPAPMNDGPNDVPAPDPPAGGAEPVGYRTVPEPVSVPDGDLPIDLVPSDLPVISEPFPPAPVDPE